MSKTVLLDLIHPNIQQDLHQFPAKPFVFGHHLKLRRKSLTATRSQKNLGISVVHACYISLKKLYFAVTIAQKAIEFFAKFRLRGPKFHINFCNLFQDDS